MLRDTNVPNDYLIEITQSGTAADHGNMIFHQSQGRKTLTFKRTEGDIDISGNIQIDPLSKFKSLLLQLLVYQSRKGFNYWWRIYFCRKDINQKDLN